MGKEKEMLIVQRGERSKLKTQDRTTLGNMERENKVRKQDTKDRQKIEKAEEGTVGEERNRCEGTREDKHKEQPGREERIKKLEGSKKKQRKQNGKEEGKIDKYDEAIVQRKYRKYATISKREMNDKDKTKEGRKENGDNMERI
ncbi:1337_t:CDS:2 [Ambispora gerdemannii]|uniref:1337_t:CDS:1 n=1 Tax=Ambispora gerdemannii TaxID=144530 RepID=A0A9N9CIJ3_9GLOM|nr:1337_t:CDS:2 [Ambispora gerdemannii]